jgi:thiol-disulfide isomerase/thioredoxin
VRRLFVLLAAATMIASADTSALQAKDRATVLLFISTECPYSNRYAPEIQRIYNEFTPRGVRFWLVYPSRTDTPPVLAKHLKAFGYPDIVLRDPGNPLLRLATPTVTPEAVVYDAAGTRVYQGRIDDRFVELMKERPAPTTHDLEQALASVLAGKTVVPAATQAVGCFIADMR